MTRSKLAARQREAPPRSVVAVNVDSRLVRALRDLAALIPGQWREAIAGPVNQLKISPSGFAFEQPRRRLRPTDVLVSSSLVLAKRLIVPVGARKDLPHAIDLLIRSQTPFEARELLCHATADGPVADGALTHTIHLVPRLPIEEALESAGVPRIGVRRIAMEDGPTGAVEFVAAFRPIQRWLRLLWVIPPVMVVVALCSWTIVESGTRAQQVAILDGLIAQELSQLRAASDELDALRTQAADGAVVTQAIANSVSSYRLLADIRAAIAPSVEITKVEFRENAMRLLVKADNALLLARELGDALQDRRVTTDGAITVGGSGAEAATIVVSERQ